MTFFSIQQEGKFFQMASEVICLKLGMKLRVVLTAGLGVCVCVYIDS